MNGKNQKKNAYQKSRKFNYEEKRERTMLLKLGNKLDNVTFSYSLKKVD